MVYVIILSAVAVIIALLNANSLEDYIPPNKVIKRDSIVVYK